MHTVRSGDATISYSKAGSGPTLLLVHGAFSDHENFWILARPALEQRFTLVSVARRGRGESSKTTGHSTEDEAHDIVAVIDDVGGDVFLLAHSGGSFCALVAAQRSPRVKGLILYEPPGPAFVPAAMDAQMREAAARGDWERVVESFLGEAHRSRVVREGSRGFLARRVEEAGDPEGIRGRRKHKESQIDTRLKRWGITVVPVQRRID